MTRAPDWYLATVGGLPARSSLYGQNRPGHDVSWFADPWFTPTSIGELVAGDVVRVPVRGVWHEGIVTERRDEDGPWVIGKSKRAGVVAEESWSVFTDGLEAERVGYFGELAPDEVLARARARLGERWSPWAHCQLFTRECHGVLDPEIVSGDLPHWFRT